MALRDAALRIGRAAASLLAAIAILCGAPSVPGRCTPGKAEPNMIVNGGFDAGLSGWSATGDAVVLAATPDSVIGGHVVRIGPGVGALRQEYVTPGLRIVRFAATLRSDPPGLRASVRAQCYDTSGRLVMDLSQSLDPKKNDAAGTEEGLYFKTQARTARLVLSIRKDSDQPGLVYAAHVVLNDYDKDRKAHAPTCDLRELMEPVWEGGTVYNETVLLVSHGGAPACGNLLYKPSRILAVRDYGLTHSYAAGRDYTLSGRSITCAPGSRMPTVKDSEMPTGEFPWPVYDGKHIVVTYTHQADAWHGPVPGYRGDLLPRTVGKLARRQPVTIVALGDSITLGLDTSGYMQISPYMPTWADLLAERLRHAYNDPRITLYNTALGGTTSGWGLENADPAAADLQPDLVIIAFGMNDFWSLSGSEFRSNIQGIMDKVRIKRPKAEFILVASMRFDPAYTSDPAYTGHLTDYVAALKSLCGPGVQCLDMHSISDALYAAKKPQDLIGNPLHPNDFLARWYAQGLAAMLVPARKAKFETLAP